MIFTHKPTAILSPVCLIIFFGLLDASPAAAQDTLYFSHTYERVSDPSTAHFYEIRNFDSTDVNRCIVRAFFADSNNLIFLRRYSNYKELIYNGKCIDWFKNGTIYREAKYSNGMLQGDEKVYYPNGQLNRKIVWDADTIVGGVFFKEDGTPKTDIYKEDLDYFVTGWLQKPSFPGGDGAWLQFLFNQVKYPKTAMENNIQGVVVVDFIVEANGEIREAFVISPPSKYLDQEALRVFSKMPRWSPGIVNGVPVRVRYKMPIRFKLE